MSEGDTALSVEEIRPSTFRRRQRSAITADVRMLLKSKPKFVRVPCPACGARMHRPKYVKRTFKYVECARCRTFYINPRPPLSVLEEFYTRSRNYAFWSKYIFPASERIRRRKIFVPRVRRVIELCEKYGVTKGALLEVGAGFGTFCIEMERRKSFKNITAIEPTSDLAALCRKRGVHVIEQPIERVEFPAQQRFDVIVNFEVIEHIFSPLEFVQHGRRLLKDGGLMILTCPNGQGFDVETLGIKSDTIDHEHLNYFNPRSIKTLFERCGFRVLEVLTPGKLDAELVRQKIQEGEYDVSKQPFLKRVLMEEWDTLRVPFQEFLVDNGLSSNMWVVAKKKRSV